MKRSMLKLAAALALGWAGFSGTDARAADETGKPNVVVILADDLGYSDLGAQGGTQIPTPNLDALARSSTRFTNAYVSCPVCSPTRAGLLTGRYQQRFGHEFNPGPQAPPNFGLAKSETTLAEALFSAGYTTGLIGKWHLGDRPGFLPNERGFKTFFGFLGGAHVYYANEKSPEQPTTRPARPVAVYRNTVKIDEPGHLTDAFTREAVSFIEQNKNDRFFLLFAPNAVHGPLQPTPEDVAKFPNLSGNRQLYAGLVVGLDRAVGKVTETLRAQGLENKTLIVFLSDNGGPRQTESDNKPLNGYKGTVLEGGIRVPFFVRWKGTLPEGAVSDEPVISLDIFPTALAVAGITTPSTNAIDGRNLLPVLQGKTTAAAPLHEGLFWKYGPQWAARQGKWKLVSREGQTKLFDLSADIGESTDLAAAHPEIVTQLTTAWQKWEAGNQPARWQTFSAREAAASSKKDAGD